MRIFWYSIFFIILTLHSCDFNQKSEVVSQGIEGIPAGLDPAYNTSGDEVQIYSQIYETLLRFGSDGKTLVPLLADHWQNSPDNKNFIFILKSHILFHDKTPLNADAACFSFNRQINLRKTFPLFEMIDSVTAVDSMTIRIRLKYPYALFPYTLTSPIGLIPISRRALEMYGDDIAHHPVGTGPFEIGEWQDSTQIVLNAFPNYHQGKGNIDKVVFRMYPKKSDFDRAILDQNVDIVYLVSGFFVDRLKWLGTINYKVLPSINTIYLGFNNSDPPFNDARLRKAVLHAINIPRLVFNINRGNAGIASDLLPTVFGLDSCSKQDGFDLEAAKNYMAELNKPRPLKAKFFFPEAGFVRQTILELLKADLAKIGIDLDVEMISTWSKHNNACRGDSAQLFLSGWQSDVLGDPENFLYSLFYSKSQYNILHYANRQVDRWLENARQEPDPKKREKLYRSIVNLIMEDTPAVFLYHVKPHFAYRKKKIKYLPVNPYGTIQYNRIILNEKIR